MHVTTDGIALKTDHTFVVHSAEMCEDGKVIEIATIQRLDRCFIGQAVGIEARAAKVDLFQFERGAVKRGKDVAGIDGVPVKATENRA